MTALDQAIIKAYLRRGGRPAPDEAEPREKVHLNAAPPHPPQQRQGEPPPQIRPGGNTPPAGTARPASIPFDALDPPLGLSASPVETLARPAASPASTAAPQIATPQIAAAEHAPATIEARLSCGPRGLAGTERKPFEPRLRIDAISWPRPSRRLRQVAGQQIKRLAEAVRRAAVSGGKVIGLVASSHGEGCTTVLLAVAMRLAELGQKTLLLDADIARPTLADQVALANQSGWRDVAVGAVPLEEVVTQSDCESVAILPYCGPASPADGPEPTRQAIAALLGRIRIHYDVVLVDLGGSLAGGALVENLAEHIDSVLAVQNVQTSSPDRLAAFRKRLRRIGLQETGVIENFVEDQTA